MASTPEGWKNYPYDDPFRHRRSALVSGEGRIDISALARVWLQDLATLGLHEVDHSSGSPPKEPSSYHPRTEPLHSDVRPIKLEKSREVLWLKPNGRRSERGYSSTEILDTPLDTDAAILAALTAVEARETKAEGLDETLVEQALGLGEEVDEATLLSEASIRALAEQVESGGERFFLYEDPRDRTGYTLEYVVGLLRHYRPEFDSLPHKERLDLVVLTQERVNTFLTALRQLRTFLEYGASEKDLRSKVEDAAGDIRAAELKDVEGLSNLKVGEILGIPIPPSDADKGNNSRAGEKVKRGRRLLISALGEEGWRKEVEAKKAERERFLSLSEEERMLTRFAESEGLTVDEARSLLARLGNKLELQE